MSKYFFVIYALLTFYASGQNGFTNRDEAENKFKDSIKIGKWIEFKDSSWKACGPGNASYYHLVIYENGIPVGVGRDFYMSDQLQNEYIYNNGLKNGAATWYYADGRLRGKATYKDDKLEGTTIWYYKNGNVMEEEIHVAGKQQGMCTWFLENGRKESDVNYLDDKKEGIQKWYNKESGKLYCDVNYTAGKKNGVQKWYNDETGAVVEETVFTNGDRNGRSTTFFNSGKLRSECVYVNDKAEGLSKSYYEDGKVKSEINYLKGKREGTFKTYWNNGQIKRHDFYEKDKFVSGKTFDDSGKEVTYYAYEIMPEFVGGMSELAKFIQKEVKYPSQSRKDGVEGRVLVKFVVDTDGSVTDVSIVNSVNKELDEEALRVVGQMPKWKPGSMDGEPARIYYHLPVRFKI